MSLEALKKTMTVTPSLRPQRPRGSLARKPRPPRRFVPERTRPLNAWKPFGLQLAVVDVTKCRQDLTGECHCPKCWHWIEWETDEDDDGL